jgi:hypothetical protein
MEGPVQLSPSPVLEYNREEEPHWPRWALALAYLITGMVVFLLSAVGVFALAIHLHNPDILALYPVGLIAAVFATLAENIWTRHVGFGALLGSVVTSTMGYAVFLFVLTQP